MNTFEQSLEFGHVAEVQWCRYLANRGSVVVPVYGATEVDDSTKAPVLFALGGNLISPDLLAMSEQGISWHEIKAKSIPGFFRKLNRWEHGIDKSLIDQYCAVEEKSHVPVWIVIREDLSPVDPNKNCQKHEMVKSDLWLLCPLKRVISYGEHRPTWPGGSCDYRRGRRGLGGWLWPRNAMKILTIKSHQEKKVA